ncbi:hypothetical protein [Elizabethkingia anophelis]|uniref:hypothetical protein n=1 Tax=Elizabethkingia anophelis TaxID=1117645 RepID=UPI002468D0D9|nr:hypothetical protein [Elizabethkingia anophelis]MCT3803524.1 hypothetical protein [Elizabethkingia anophelis]MDV3945126.1 hypothetical protein [Elizabethkingia anophelis]WGL71027.1 hypothetical protein QFB79_06635 [Elizabethkingia anophelis]CAH1149208.1 hypothetical protein EAVNVB490_03295 [Elizabethkingia anophelis]CAI9672193.1 hypothetical protein EAVNNN508_03291 [Elizabethkingia anophelis]
MKADIEKQAAELLLKRGVIVPVTAPLLFRLFRKRIINLVVKSPTVLTYLKVAHKFLEMEVDPDRDIELKEAFEVYAKHGKKESEIIALCLLNNRFLYWLHKPLAWWLRGKVTETESNYLYQLIVVYGGVQDFINTIRLIKTTRMTAPMNLSQKKVS